MEGCGGGEGLWVDFLAVFFEVLQHHGFVLLYACIVSFVEVCLYHPNPILVDPSFKAVLKHGNSPDNFRPQTPNHHGLRLPSSPHLLHEFVK